MLSGLTVFAMRRARTGQSGQLIRDEIISLYGKAKSLLIL